MTSQPSPFTRLAAVCLLGISSAAMSDDALQVQLTSFRVVSSADGGSTLVPSETVKPGDVIEYRAVYRNTSDTPLRGLVTTLPIPLAGASYIDGSARPAGALASTDGTTFAPTPLQRVAAASGDTPRTEPVPVAEYRALRWTWSQIAPGASQTVAARVRVLSDAPATPSTNQGESP